MKENRENNTGMILGLVILVLVIIGGVFSYQSAHADNGTVTIGITDPSTVINGVSDVSLEIKKIELHSVTKGWITASSDDHTYSLLTLNASGKTELYTDAKVPADTYDQVRVTVGDVTVHGTNGTTHTAIKPSDVIVFGATLHVVKADHSYLKLDFMASQSLHTTTTADQYVFAPVATIHTESHTTVNTSDHTNVVATGGTVDSDLHVGVDLDGQSKQDFVLASDTNTTSHIQVDTSVANQPHFMLGGHLYVPVVHTEATTTDTTHTTTGPTQNYMPVDTQTGTDVQTHSTSTTTGPAGFLRTNTDASGSVQTNGGVQNY